MFVRWIGLLFLLSGCTVAPVPPSSTAMPAATPPRVVEAPVGQPAATTGPATPTPTPPPTPRPTPPPGVEFAEQPVTLIPLVGPITSSRAEISAMAWYGDRLILVPQFPHRFGPGDGVLFTLTRSEILAWLDGERGEALVPTLLPLSAPGVAELPGYEGYEAIGFLGDQVFATVEAEPVFGGAMQGWLLSGWMEPDLQLLHLSVESATALDPQADISNMSDEALVLFASPDGPGVITLYEANGILVNSDPVARRFDLDLTPLEPIPFPHVEFRITDATEIDARSRFWAINYFFPGDLRLRSELLARVELPQVERLLEFELTPEGVRRTDTPPLPLQLADTARNWEGLVRLEERGFLLATDRFPTTLLAFVPLPR